MSKYDYKRDGLEHLERPGCIINIRTKLYNCDDKEVTSIEILPDTGWKLDGNRVIKEVI